MGRPGQVALLGCGGWGSNIARCLAELGRLGAVADPSPAARQRAANLGGGVRSFDGPGPALDDPSIRAVMIATPPETHYRLARAALDAGKDVFVEKPMTVGVEDARELVARARAADRVLMVGHLLEYHPAVLRLLDMVRAGELGEVRYLVSNRLNLGKIRTEENALWSFAPHDIAVILRLVEAMPYEVVATGGSYISPGVADVTVTQLRFENGIRAHIFVSWLHPFKEQRLVVIGSRKMASFDDVARKLVLYDQRVEGAPQAPVPVRGDLGVEVPYASDEPLKMECLHFLQCVDERRRPRTDGESGLRVLQVLDASQRSLTLHGRPTPIPAESPAEAGPGIHVTTVAHAPVRSR